MGLPRTRVFRVSDTIRTVVWGLSWGPPVCGNCDMVANLKAGSEMSLGTTPKFNKLARAHPPSIQTTVYLT